MLTFVKGQTVAEEKGQGTAGAGSFAQLRAEIRRLTGELAKAEMRIAELEARADSDPLLDILNRRGFERELRRSLAYVRRYGTAAALLFIDLDGFKAVNDRHGHRAGDMLLKSVAATLATHVRASDLVGRLGGDEFGVVLWNIEQSQAAAKARELESLIEATRVVHAGSVLSVGASAGITPLSSDANAAALLEEADRKMYARKEDRRKSLSFRGGP
ncbi:MAG TPA: GGDEF domain-containing protein [Pseudolabrys sp.]|nr:GGDEF domain-containing protein [Pseudolabrys sp.]